MNFENRNGQNVPRDDIIVWIVGEIQHGRIVNRSMDSVQRVMNRFHLPRRNYERINGLVRRAIDRHVIAPERRPIAPIVPIEHPVVQPPAPIEPVVQPPGPIEPVVQPPAPIAPVVNPPPIEPVVNPPPPIEQPVVQPVAPIEAVVQPVAPIEPVVDPPAPRPQPLRTINDVHRAYRQLGLGEQTYFHVLISPPCCKYTNNTVIAAVEVEQHEIVGIFRGKIINGAVFRKKETNKELCIRLHNNENNVQQFFSTEPFGWQNINNFILDNDNYNYNNIILDDPALPDNMNKCLIVVANRHIETGEELSIELID